MFIIDKLLLFPISATVWAARRIQNALEQEREAEPARITTELRELYMMLETGRMTHSEFEAREKALLDQLDRLEQPEPPEQTVSLSHDAPGMASPPVDNSRISAPGP